MFQPILVSQVGNETHKRGYKIIDFFPYRDLRCWASQYGSNLFHAVSVASTFRRRHRCWCSICFVTPFHDRGATGVNHIFDSALLANLGPSCAFKLPSKSYITYSIHQPTGTLTGSENAKQSKFWRIVAACLVGPIVCCKYRKPIPVYFLHHVLAIMAQMLKLKPNKTEKSQVGNFRWPVWPSPANHLLTPFILCSQLHILRFLSEISWQNTYGRS